MYSKQITISTSSQAIGNRPKKTLTIEDLYNSVASFVCIMAHSVHFEIKNVHYEKKYVHHLYSTK